MPEIKPIGIVKVILLFALTSAFIAFGLYYLIPIYMTLTIDFLPAYLLAFYIPFIAIFVLSFVLFKIEGNKLSLSNIIVRFRLFKLSKKDWLTALLLFIGCFGTYAILSFTSTLLAHISLFSPPSFFPAEINPLKIKSNAGLFMDYPMIGNWWILLLYFIGWFFNIFGEEFLWRGYLLPRMEVKWKNKAWLINGLCWSAWHIFWKWNILIIIPTAILIPLIAQKRKNTLIGIIVHGSMNFIPIIYLILGVVGIIR